MCAQRTDYWIAGGYLVKLSASAAVVVRLAYINIGTQHVFPPLSDRVSTVNNQVMEQKSHACFRRYVQTVVFGDECRIIAKRRRSTFKSVVQVNHEREEATLARLSFEITVLVLIELLSDIVPIESQSLVDPNRKPFHFEARWDKWTNAFVQRSSTHLIIEHHSIIVPHALHKHHTYLGAHGSVPKALVFA